MGMAKSNSESDPNVVAQIYLFSAELWLTGARQEPRHNLPIRITAERDSSHRTLSESFELRFGLSLVFRKSYPLADDFPALVVPRLHAIP
jgi:hypothetical protein